MNDFHELLKRLESGTREQTWEAAKQLESIILEICSSLLRELKEARSADARAAAAYVLGFGRFASARTSLEEVLDDVNEKVLVRGHAAEALAYIQSKESLGALLKHINDDNPEVSYWCIFALGGLGSASAIPVLRQVTKAEPEKFFGDHSLRAEALEAIAKINEGANTGKTD